jgi:hypothetical protein
MIRVMSVSENPPAITFRYKVVQQSGAATQTAK